LTYFEKHYSQDNCLLECRLTKIVERCGCAPWFLKQVDYKVCNIDGNECFKRQLDSYSEDLTDRADCDCRGDCGGIHFFASATRSPYSNRSLADPDAYFNPETGTGLLYNYLMDPENAFTDEITYNLTRLLYNQTRKELAAKRFNEDITVLNFFFDTPIITRYYKVFSWISIK
jgi:hypothetical protein